VEYSRRHLFRMGQAILAAAALPEVTFSADWGDDGFALTQRKFAPLVNAAFRVQSDSGASRWFTLLSVEDLTPKGPVYQLPMVVPRHLKIPASPKTEAFALHFASSGEAIPQGTYVFEHESTGRLPLFIVPSGNSTFIAIVNRLTLPGTKTY
jgi:hypothetical protein